MCWAIDDHRRAALQEVRFAVEDATRGQQFEHRLRDFNNLPSTRLWRTFRTILQVEAVRVQARLKGKSQDRARTPRAPSRR